MFMHRYAKLICMTESVSESSATIPSNLIVKKSMKILHVDDDPSFLKVAKQCLETQGEFEVDTASSVDEALEKLKKTDYHVVVSDYQMPGKDDLELLKKLREKGNTIPFIVFTGKGREEIAIKALNLGAAEYFNKHGEPETVYGELAHGIRRAVERKKADMKMWEREERLRAVFGSSPDAITVSDLHGNILDCNEAALRLMGYSSKEEIVGRNCLELVAEKDRESALKSLKIAFDQGTAKSVEHTFLKKNGEEYQGELSASILRDSVGNPVCFVGVIRDTSERKKAEQTLRVSLDRYRSFIEVTGELGWTTNANGEVVEDIPSFREFTGLTYEEIKGWGWSKALHPDDLERTTRIWKEATATKSKYEVEYRLRRHDGVYRYFIARSVPVLKEDGSIREWVGTCIDITERKKAEETLRKSEEKFRNLFDRANDAIMYLDRYGRILDVNARTVEMFGGTREELIGKHFAKIGIFSIKETPMLMRNFADVLAGKKVNLNVSIKNKKSQEIALDCSVSLVKTDEFAGIVVIARDMSERQKAEEELRNSEERLNILFELAPDAYYLNDLKGNFIDGNKAAEEITGYSKSELVGKSFLKLHLLLRSQIPKAVKLLTLNAMGKPTGPDEFFLNRKDRTQVQVEIRTFPTKIQNQKLVLGIARDITERKKAEKLIVESQQRFAALFSNNPEATVYTDPSMHILDINPRFTSLFGYSLDEVKGKHLNDIVVPDSHIEEARMLDSKTGEGYIYHDTVRKRKDGSLIPVSISAASISIQGQLAGIVGVYKDISEQTSSRKKLVAMNEKLRVVGGMTRHDVRNKLAAIVGNTYLVKKEMAGNEKVLDRLEEIEKAVQQSVKIFDFAKTYEMLGAEEMAYVDVGKTVKDAASLFTDLKGAKVINDCRGLDVFADSLLQQLFYNLIDNSLKYGQKMTTIRVHYEESGKSYLELVYEDDGVGIPVAGKTKLFTEGYSTGGSTGYGLYLIKKMVEVYGWTIKETGEPGKGALFVVTIPKMNEKGRISYKLH
jgi:PAS domain S-box-containing protein